MRSLDVHTHSVKFSCEPQCCAKHTQSFPGEGNRQKNGSPDYYSGEPFFHPCAKRYEWRALKQPVSQPRCNPRRALVLIERWVVLRDIRHAQLAGRADALHHRFDHQQGHAQRSG